MGPMILWTSFVDGSNDNFCSPPPCLVEEEKEEGQKSCKLVSFPDKLLRRKGKGEREGNRTQGGTNDQPSLVFRCIALGTFPDMRC